MGNLNSAWTQNNQTIPEKENADEAEEDEEMTGEENTNENAQIINHRDYIFVPGNRESETSKSHWLYIRKYSLPARSIKIIKDRNQIKISWTFTPLPTKCIEEFIPVSNPLRIKLLTDLLENTNVIHSTIPLPHPIETSKVKVWTEKDTEFLILKLPFEEIKYDDKVIVY